MKGKSLQISSLWLFSYLFWIFVIFLFFGFVFLFLSWEIILVTCIDPIQRKKSKDYQSESKFGSCMFLRFNPTLLLSSSTTFRGCVVRFSFLVLSYHLFFLLNLFFFWFCEGFQEILKGGLLDKKSKVLENENWPWEWIMRMNYENESWGLIMRIGHFFLQSLAMYGSFFEFQFLGGSSSFFFFFLSCVEWRSLVYFFLGVLGLFVERDSILPVFSRAQCSSHLFLFLFCLFFPLFLCFVFWFS